MIILLFKLFLVGLEDHTNRDCLMVVILTHGDEDHFLRAKDIYYHLRSVMRHFSDEECPTLKGKPKLFIIQERLNYMSYLLS